MKDFTKIEQDRIIHKDEFFFIIKDGFPVNPGHLLIISNEVKADFFELSDDEKIQLPKTIEKAKEIIKIINQMDLTLE
jgi:diadenosine tetraphosphate (Ap4A) HIT family hydrolase